MRGINMGGIASRGPGRKLFLVQLEQARTRQGRREQA